MKPTTPTKAGQATPEQIAEWKALHTDGIYFVATDKYIAYFREPKFQDVEAAHAASEPGKPFAAIRKFADLTWIGGSKEILEGMTFFGAKAEIAKHWNGPDATSGNL